MTIRWIFLKIKIALFSVRDSLEYDNNHPPSPVSILVLSLEKTPCNGKNLNIAQKIRHAQTHKNYAATVVMAMPTFEEGRTNNITANVKSVFLCSKTQTFGYRFFFISVLGTFYITLVNVVFTFFLSLSPSFSVSLVLSLFTPPLYMIWKWHVQRAMSFYMLYYISHSQTTKTNFSVLELSRKL